MSDSEYTEPFGSAFNSLPHGQKWNTWKEQKGRWACGHCGAIMDDGPNHPSPFHGASVHCGECDGVLTRRTGGGQLDPFEWVLVPNAALTGGEAVPSNGVVGGPKTPDTERAKWPDCHCNVWGSHWCTEVCEPENEQRKSANAGHQILREAK